MRNFGCAAAVALLAAGSAAGCGGDDALTKSEFVKKGNAICAKGSKEIDSAAKKTFGKKKPTKQKITKFAEDEAIPSIEDQISGLRDLKPPKADEDKVKKIIDAADAALSKAKDDPAIFASGKDPFADANKKAAAYGLSKCGEG